MKTAGSSGRRVWNLLLAPALLLSAGSALAVPIDVSIDTTLLSGTSGQLAFVLTSPDPASNSATITGFATDGTLGSAFEFGGPITGSLPGVVTIGDTFFFNQLAQDIVFGTTISFFVELTTNFTIGSIPDGFSFFLLDPTTFAPLFETTDPTGTDALFAIDIDGSATGQLSVYTAVGDPAVATWTAVPIPEPTTLFLLMSGLGGLVLRRVNETNASKKNNQPHQGFLRVTD